MCKEPAPLQGTSGIFQQGRGRAERHGSAATASRGESRGVKSAAVGEVARGEKDGEMQRWAGGGGGRRRGGSGAAQSTNRGEVTMAAAGSVLLRSFVALLGAWLLGCSPACISSLRLAGGSTEGVRAVPFRASAQGPRLSPPPAGVGLRRAVGVSAHDFRRRRRQFQRGGCFVSRRPMLTAATATATATAPCWLPGACIAVGEEVLQRAPPSSTRPALDIA